MVMSKKAVPRTAARSAPYGARVARSVGRGPSGPSAQASRAIPPRPASPGLLSESGVPINSLAEVHCRRRSSIDTVRFVYEIENFSFFTDTRGPELDIVESPEFATSNGDYKWKLRLIIHPRPDRPSDETCKEFIQVFLNLSSSKRGPNGSVPVKVQLIMPRMREGTEDQSYQITRSRDFRFGETWGFRRFIMRR